MLAKTLNCFQLIFWKQAKAKAGKTESLLLFLATLCWFLGNLSVHFVLYRHRVYAWLERSHFHRQPEFLKPMTNWGGNYEGNWKTRKSEAVIWTVKKKKKTRQGKVLIKTITRETPLGNPLLTKWLSGFGQINHLPYLISTTHPHIQLSTSMLLPSSWLPHKHS